MIIKSPVDSIRASRGVSWTLLTSLAFALSACGNETSTADDPPASPAAREVPSPAGPAGVEDEIADATPVEPLDVAALEQLIEANHGQVLLINLWATWCAPCLREIPELVRLEQDLGPRGLRVIGLSLDDPGDRKVVEQFRARWFPAFTTYHAADDWYALVAPLDPDWSSVLPTSFVIDRNGTRIATLPGGQSYEAFAKIVESVL